MTIRPRASSVQAPWAGSEPPGTSRRVCLKTRSLAIFGALALFNAAVWCWAVVVFQGHPALLGTALLIYGLGLRHAVDADHIAAIDNVTRKLMHEGKCPVTVGFYFAMGHSTIVVVVAALVASAAAMLSRIESFKSVGGVISTGTSAMFLIALAAMNLAVFFSIYRRYRAFRRGDATLEQAVAGVRAGGGLLARVFQPLFGLVGKSWHMFALGLLFGLGFDTATEIALFGLSAAQAAKGISLGAILAFPLLFAAGMSLVDTADGVLMLGAYQWAFVRPVRKLYYNMAITLVSVFVALFIGGIETLGLMADQFDLQGDFWRGVTALDTHFNSIGFLIVGLFIAAWLISWALYRLRGIDKLDMPRDRAAVRSP
jgi:high-affinity nickel-transport protein